MHVDCLAQETLASLQPFVRVAFDSAVVVLRMSTAFWFIYLNVENVV